MKGPIAVVCITKPDGLASDSLAHFLKEAPGQAALELKTCPFSPEPEIPPGTDVLVVWTDDAAAGGEEFGRLFAHVSPVPTIVVARSIEDRAMLDFVARGAHDCLAEEEASGPRLLRALNYAVQRRGRRMKLNEEELAHIRQEVVRSQQQFRDSEALYHSLVENLVQNIFRKDLEGRFTFANTNFCLAIGKHVNQVLGKTDFDFFPKDLAAKYQADDHKVIATGKVLEAEEEYEAANGERLVVKVVKTPVHNAAGDIVGMQGIFWDITDQKRAQAELAASRERFALALRGSTDGIWDWDVRTNEIYFSARFKELLGYGYDELDNRFAEWEKRIYPEDREKALAAFENHLKYEAPFDVEYRLRCQDGSYRWFRVRGLAVRHPDGKATRMAGSISDITKRKEAEEQLRARTEDLERSNRDLEQFAYIASHDLKEPLRMVTSYVQLLEHRYGKQLDDDARDFISFAVDGAKRMKRLIDGLLEFSRIGTRGKELLPTRMEDVLHDSLANLEVLIQEKNATVTQGPLPRVLGDPVQLGQLLQNLLGNALKFCTDNPKIHVSAEPGSAPNEWTFSVRDTGIGIRPEHAEKIFQIYRRLHSRAHYEGTGIGLAVCRKIVERHGGKIWVDSEMGRGSTFRFTLQGAEDTASP